MISRSLLLILVVLASASALAQVAITTPAIPGALDGQSSYSATIDATDTTPGAGPYIWSIAGDPLPGTLVFDDAATGLSTTITGAVSGLSGGEYDLIVTVTDTKTAVNSFTRTFTLIVMDAIPITLLILTQTSDVPEATEGESYHLGLVGWDGTGGTGPYTWSMAATSVALPPGLSLDTSQTGLFSQITGTPTTSLAAGSYNLRVRIEDSGGTLSHERDLTLVVNAASTTGSPQIDSPTTLPAAVEGEDYGTQTITASGGTSSYQWSISSGSLPTGLSLDLTATGLTTSISGTPATGTAALSPYDITVQILDGTSLTATRDYSIVVTDFGIVTDATLPAGTEGETYTPVTIQASGGTAPYVWQISASAPLGLAGLTIDDTATGTSTTFSGTPEAGTGGNSYAITIQVTDQNGAGTTIPKVFTIAISSPSTTGLAFTTDTLADGTVGTAYSATVVTTGGTGPFTWSLASGSGPLPTGVLLNTSSTTNSTTLSGSPTSEGSYSFTLRITDTSDASYVEQPLQITVDSSGGGTTGLLTLGGGGGGCSLSREGSSLWILLLGGAAFVCLLVRKPTRQKSVS